MNGFFLLGMALAVIGWIVWTDYIEPALSGLTWREPENIGADKVFAARTYQHMAQPTIYEGIDQMTNESTVKQRYPRAVHEAYKVFPNTSHSPLEWVVYDRPYERDRPGRGVLGMGRTREAAWRQAATRIKREQL